MINDSVYIVEENQTIDLVRDEIFSRDVLSDLLRGQELVTVFRQSWGDKIISQFAARGLRVKVIVHVPDDEETYKIYFVISDNQLNTYIPSLLTCILGERIKRYLSDMHGLEAEHVWIVFRRDPNEIFHFINEIPNNVLNITISKIPHRDLEYLNSILNQEEERLKEEYKERLKDANTIITVILTLLMPLFLPIPITLPSL